MQSLVFRQLDPEALKDLETMGLVQYCYQPFANMVKSGLAHIPLPDATVVSAVWEFVKKWGTLGQLRKLRELLVAAGVEPPPLELPTETKMSIRERRQLRTSRFLVLSGN